MHVRLDFSGLYSEVHGEPTPPISLFANSPVVGAAEMETTVAKMLVSIEENCIFFFFAAWNLVLLRDMFGLAS